MGFGLYQEQLVVAFISNYYMTLLLFKFVFKGLVLKENVLVCGHP